MPQKPLDEHPRTLGKRLQAARKRLGITQRQAAERIGISKHHYARIERDIGLPSVEVLAMLLGPMNVTADELLRLDLGSEPTGVTMRLELPPELAKLVDRIVAQDAAPLMRALLLAIDERDRE